MCRDVPVWLTLALPGVNADETGRCWVFFLGTIFDFSGYCQTSDICLHTALVEVVHSTNRMVKELFWSQALQLN